MEAKMGNDQETGAALGAGYLGILTRIGLCY